MDISKVDTLIQFALTVAGQEVEYTSRRLGPIHFIKYVYLADLYYSEKNNGQTFTGIPWQFYKFGPWSQEVNERIDPALRVVGAEKFSFPSDYEGRDEWFRWQLSDENLLDSLERKLPIVITARLKRDIHKYGQEKYGQDTPSLLHYVYSTAPMRRAAPHDLLDFTPQEVQPPAEVPPSRLSQLSNKKKKQFRDKMFALKAEIDKKKELSPKKEQLVDPVPDPRYDEIYFEGLELIESLAGSRMEPGAYKAVFSYSVWKSSIRRGEDVPD